ncbi:family 10 glycosylhydrolase [Pelagicoccus sp. SDUM812002]|uniref:glycoside hydrolase family 10 protein n=1 Tax=Pelagicoccus sp. SDUM812002 TaxID=3041266 RepID=UPI00280C4CAA|nr:family 10 glycosylhydrolase [Pelagicoccus sp. SDUM812002]MDQ8187732.1 family 10 glycosylhydrolase [Pelagicoccus sp. SDUM812002]
MVESGHNFRKALATAFVAALFAVCFLPGCSSDIEEPVEVAATVPSLTPPEIAREFRGVWIPTVANLSWPSKPGLSIADQQAELLALLDEALELNQNAVILQVRPACDAFYLSDIEPWSEYLTGKQGQGPLPFYDPLEFAVTEAHQRGLELHAWFNPYRVRSLKITAPAADSHVSKRHPEWVRTYGSLLWLDPGLPEVQDYTLQVVLDVVQRYDIDAVHFDDYFYPYPEKDKKGKYLDFPDNLSWEKFGKETGLIRSDWRRRNVDEFVHKVYREIHDVKPQIKFGISPFGIWRPGHPDTIAGLDAYEALYADARKWLREGWCDYLAPQLYWPINDPPTSYPILLDWWTGQSLLDRHVFPGLNALKVLDGWPVAEISRQIEFTRTQPRAGGQILWSVNAYRDKKAFKDELAGEVYTEPALSPRFEWLDSTPPATPTLSMNVADNGYEATWSALGDEEAWLWVVQTLERGEWKTSILPRGETSFRFVSTIEGVAVTSVDRSGNTSLPAVLEVESGESRDQGADR